MEANSYANILHCDNIQKKNLQIMVQRNVKETCLNSEWKWIDKWGIKNPHPFNPYILL
jgi:hypothetical protein